MADSLTAADVWSDIASVRQHAPLVHSITNFVVMNFNANVLLAAGASPVMAHAHEEVAEMAGIAQSLVLNIGTLEPYWIDSMCLALQVAKQRGIPVVLDPVGAGATRYRDASLARILQTLTAQPVGAGANVVRGNASEIMRTAGAAVATRGVDSSAAANDAVDSARALAATNAGVVCVSGATDHVLDHQGRWARLDNGHPWMTKITGVGCSATALIGAFCAVQPDAWRATVSAMALMGLAGEIAAEQAQARQQGVGSMAVLLLDALQLLDEATLQSRLRLQCTA
jgi:hydroxyethylthiazole kinase